MTDNWIALLRTAHTEFTARVAAVVDWEAPTPDTDWNVRDLVTHVTEDLQWVPELLAGRTTAEAKLAMAPLGDDLPAEWNRYSVAALEAWESADLDARVHLSYDTVSASEYLAEQVGDITIHTWDLARATGTSEELDEDLVDAVWAVFEPQAGQLEASGLYAPAVAVPNDAPLRIRLLALTGRDAG
ncbi:TIGR03086 family protein [Frondihabitans sucicola]|uniref:TIGR03086 family protein n=1 Tax=Frondihabitans sucicola TaxID=1268041 RepID=A0ABM8GNB9_9MICO|nr:TIGR03086 family metal-binding protein [Frondihabitans sucicola]BDZ49920.1 TIGR03086 family protein [Frondihabitans sucicola]